MADSKLRVGPLPSGSYAYRIGNRISESKYANAESARADGRRPQRVNANGRLEPDVNESEAYEKYLEAVATSRGE
jgi:hypothetical protein